MKKTKETTAVCAGVGGAVGGAVAMLPAFPVAHWGISMMISPLVATVVGDVGREEIQ